MNEQEARGEPAGLSLSIDVVIPLGPADAAMIDVAIAGVRRYILNLRRIYIVAAAPVDVPDVIFVDEAAFPFSRADVAAALQQSPRTGWYLQQLLKLYFQKIVPDALDNILVVDADVIFLRHCQFIEGDGRVRFAIGREHHQPYFAHMSKLHPTLWRRKPSASGVAHCMVFTRQWVDELFQLVEKHHGGAPFWRIFLAAVDPPSEFSGASEYEIYFNFVLARHPREVVIHLFLWFNIRSPDLSGIDADYVAFHARGRPGSDPIATLRASLARR